MRTAKQLCIAILVIVAISSLIGSYHLISDSTGYSLRLRLDDLKGSPFHDYSIPGWIMLFAVSGVSILTIYFSINHIKKYPLWMMAEGFILIIVVLLQLIITEFNFLQLLYGLFGLALLLLGNLIRKNLNNPSIHHVKINPPHPQKKSHHHKHRKKH